MTMALSLLCRVIRRRLERGEDLNGCRQELCANLFAGSG